MTTQWWGEFLLVALVLGALMTLVFRAFEWCLKKAANWHFDYCERQKQEERENRADVSKRQAYLEWETRLERDKARRLGGRPTLMGSDRRWYDRWDDHTDGREWNDPEGITGNRAVNDFAATVEELEAAQASFQVGRLSQSVKDFNEAVMSGKAVPPGARRRRGD